MTPGAGTGAGGWVVERRMGGAGALHEPWPAAGDEHRPRVAVCVVTSPALVLGSTQAQVCGRGSPSADPAIVRRRSGGGAVLVAPGAQVWVDVWVPRGHPRWEDDVVRAAWWVGEAWARALRTLGVPAVAVHRGPSDPRTRPDVCFAGIGPGEVEGGDPPRKIVGISQHRRRAGARLSTMAPVRWDPAGTIGALVAAGIVPPEAVSTVEVATWSAAWGLADLVPRSHPGQLTALVEDAAVAELTAAGG